MSKVLTVVAAFFFLGGLALTVGYAANQLVQWQTERTFDLAHVEFFYLGGIAASIGMLTLALLEIRMAILLTLDHSESEPSDSPQTGQGASRKRARQPWRKSDAQRSFLDTRD